MKIEVEQEFKPVKVVLESEFEVKALKILCGYENTSTDRMVADSYFNKEDRPKLVSLFRNIYCGLANAGS